MYYHDVGQPNHLFSKTVHLVIGNGNEEENIRSTQFWTTSLWPIVMKKASVISKILVRIHNINIS